MAEPAKDNAPKTGDEKASKAAPENANSAEDISEIRAEIEKIKRENLTGQQLRMARKLAVKNKIDATSDLDAVRLLRLRGIDPFQDDTVIAQITPIQVPASQANNPAAAPQNLPANISQAAVGQPAAPAPLDEGTRLKEIARIQKDMVRRRRRRFVQSIAKLLIFVGIPTMIAGYYFYNEATPMYSTTSHFSIQKAENPVASGGGGLLPSANPLANAPDSIGIQDYLTAMAAMIRLDEEHGFRSEFQGEKIDPLQRLEDDATNEAAFKVYQKRVQIGFDPTEGILKMEVTTPNPETALLFNQSLISYAEEKINESTQRKRDDVMKGAMQSYAALEKKREIAAAALLSVQKEADTISTETKVGSISQQITTLETQLTEREIELILLEANPRPQKAKVDALKSIIDALKAKVVKLNEELTKGNAQSESLAETAAKIRGAESDLELATVMLAEASGSLETARIEAIRQTTFVSANVEPILPQEPSYPRKFENTLLAFLVFAGIYLMLALTASILREQISS